MQLRRPTTSNPGSAPHSPGSFVNKPTGRPDWFKEWIDDKGEWVLLTCGDKADLKDRGQLILQGEKKGDLLVICEKCWQIPAIERHLSYSEYRGIPTAVIPDEPLF
jgi:hypothetical protein